MRPSKSTVFIEVSCVLTELRSTVVMFSLFCISMVGCIGRMEFAAFEIDKCRKRLARISMSRSEINFAGSVVFGLLSVEIAKLLESSVPSWTSMIVEFDVTSVDFGGTETVKPWNKLVRFSMSRVFNAVIMDLEDVEINKHLKRRVRSCIANSITLSAGVDIIKPWNNLARFSMSMSFFVEIDRPSKRIVRNCISKSMVLWFGVTVCGAEIDRRAKGLERYSISNAVTTPVVVESVKIPKRALRSSISMVLSVEVDSKFWRLVGVWLSVTAIVERTAMIVQ